MNKEQVAALKEAIKVLIKKKRKELESNPQVFSALKDPKKKSFQLINEQIDIILNTIRPGDQNNPTSIFLLKKRMLPILTSYEFADMTYLENLIKKESHFDDTETTLDTDTALSEHLRDNVHENSYFLVPFLYTLLKEDKKEEFKDQISFSYIHHRRKTPQDEQNEQSHHEIEHEFNLITTLKKIYPQEKWVKEREKKHIETTSNFIKEAIRYRLTAIKNLTKSQDDKISLIQKLKDFIQKIESNKAYQASIRKFCSDENVKSLRDYLQRILPDAPSFFLGKTAKKEKIMEAKREIKSTSFKITTAKDIMKITQHVDDEQLTEVLTKIKPQLSHIIKANIEEFVNVFMRLAVSVRQFMFPLIMDKLCLNIQNIIQFRKVWQCISPEEKDIFLEKFFQKYFKKNIKLKELGELLSFLNKEQCRMILEALKNKIKFNMYSEDDLRDLFRSLDESKAELFLDVFKDDFLAVVLNLYDLGVEGNASWVAIQKRSPKPATNILCNLLLHVDKKEYRSVLDVIKEKLPFILQHRNFSIDPEDLSDEKCKILLHFFSDMQNKDEAKNFERYISSVSGKKSAIGDCKKEFLEAYQKKSRYHGLFRNFKATGVNKDWTLTEIINHAKAHNNRSRKVCQELEWMDKNGVILPGAPECIKNISPMDALLLTPNYFSPK